METKKILGSKKTEYWLIAGIISALLVSVFLSAVNPNNPKNTTLDTPTTEITEDTLTYETRDITVGEQSYTVLVSQNEEQRILGLSNRTELPKGIDGMLFIFPEPDTYGIWMKDMQFTIDILWLDEEFNIVDQRLNVSPDTFPESFTPSSPALYVLELPV